MRSSPITSTTPYRATSSMPRPDTSNTLARSRWGRPPSPSPPTPAVKRSAVVNGDTNNAAKTPAGAAAAPPPMETATVAAGTIPASVTVDPSGRYAYVANDSSANVSQYTIGANGALT